MGRLETSIQSATLKKLRALPNSWWFKIHDFFTAGIPDILGLYQGRFIGIEIKKPGERPTPLQARIISKINKCGGIAFWIDDPKQINHYISAWLDHA